MSVPKLFNRSSSARQGEAYVSPAGHAPSTHSTLDAIRTSLTSIAAARPQSAGRTRTTPLFTFGSSSVSSAANVTATSNMSIHQRTSSQPDEVAAAAVLAQDHYLVSTQRSLERVMREKHDIERQCLQMEVLLADTRRERDDARLVATDLSDRLTAVGALEAQAHAAHGLRQVVESQAAQLEAQQAHLAAIEAACRQQLDEYEQRFERLHQQQQQQQEQHARSAHSPTTPPPMDDEVLAQALRAVEALRIVYPHDTSPAAHDLAGILNFFVSRVSDFHAASDEAAALQTAVATLEVQLEGVQHEKVQLHRRLTALIERYEVADATMKRQLHQQGERCIDLEQRVEQLLAQLVDQPPPHSSTSATLSASVLLDSANRQQDLTLGTSGVSPKHSSAASTPSMGGSGSRGKEKLSAAEIFDEIRATARRLEAEYAPAGDQQLSPKSGNTKKATAPPAAATFADRFSTFLGAVSAKVDILGHTAAQLAADSSHKQQQQHLGDAKQQQKLNAAALARAASDYQSTIADITASFSDEKQRLTREIATQQRTIIVLESQVLSLEADKQRLHDELATASTESRAVTQRQASLTELHRTEVEQLTTQLALLQEASAMAMTAKSTLSTIPPSRWSSAASLLASYAEEEPLLDLLTLTEAPLPDEAGAGFDALAAGPDALVRIGVAIARDVGLTTGGSAALVDERTLAQLLHALQRGYPANPYHNAMHAADVAQHCFVMLRQAGVLAAMGGVERLACLVACVAHDYQHPGRTNAFLATIRDPVAIRYNDRSVLENHHVAAAFQLLQDSRLDVTARLSAADAAAFRSAVLAIVLGTDMAQHMGHVKALTQRVVEGDAPNAAASEADRLLVVATVVHAADIGASCRPFAVAEPWALRVLAEFRQQGEDEERRGLKVSFGCEANPDVPRSQVGFIDMFVLPLLRLLAHMHPGLAPTLAGLVETRRRWAERMPAPGPALPEDVLAAAVAARADTETTKSPSFGASSGIASSPDVSADVVGLLEEAQAEVERLHEENRLLFERLETVLALAERQKRLEDF